jgi:hypothetical protein
LLNSAQQEILVFETYNSAQSTHHKKKHGNQIVSEASHVALRGWLQSKARQR